MAHLRDYDTLDEAYAHVQELLDGAALQATAASRPFEVFDDVGRVTRRAARRYYVGSNAVSLSTDHRTLYRIDPIRSAADVAAAVRNPIPLDPLSTGVSATLLRRAALLLDVPVPARGDWAARDVVVDRVQDLLLPLEGALGVVVDEEDGTRMHQHRVGSWVVRLGLGNRVVASLVSTNESTAIAPAELSVLSSARRDAERLLGCTPSEAEEFVLTALSHFSGIRPAERTDLRDHPDCGVFRVTFDGEPFHLGSRSEHLRIFVAADGRRVLRVHWTSSRSAASPGEAGPDHP